MYSVSFKFYVRFRHAVLAEDKPFNRGEENRVFAIFIAKACKTPCANPWQNNYIYLLLNFYRRKYVNFYLFVFII